jgi:NAD(P)-dependent dehydrogenase (short-subunit alcohol dehydrogenase family)
MSGNTSGGLYIYRSSKAALNAVWRSLAIDWTPDNVVCVLLSPGWVRTDMGGASADLAPEESVSALRRVIDGLTPNDTGRFLDHTGEQIPW